MKNVAVNFPLLVLPLGAALLHRLYGMAASPRQDSINGEAVVHSSSSRDEAEPARAERYHPRSILFSGPPQVMLSTLHKQRAGSSRTRASPFTP